MLKLLIGGSGGAIAKSLRAMVTSHNLDEAETVPVESAATYLVNHTRELHSRRRIERLCGPACEPSPAPVRST